MFTSHYSFASLFLHAHPLLLLLLLLISSSSFVSPVSAIDVPGQQMLRFFKGVTNKHNSWNSTNNLVDWRCGSSACCSVDGSGFYSCTRWPKLNGKLSSAAANSFNDNAFKLRYFTIEMRWGGSAGGTLSGSVDFSKLPPSLKEFHLNGVKLKGMDLQWSHLSHLVELERLELNNCAIGGALDWSQPLPAALKYLELSDNYMTGDLDLTRYDGTSLLNLNLHRNKFTGDISPARMPRQLQYLNLRYNTGVAGDFSRLDQIPRGMQRLHIGAAKKVTGTDLQWQDLPDGMISLTLRETGINGAFSLKPFAKFSELVYLDVHGEYGANAAGKLTGEIFLNDLCDTPITTLICSRNKLTGPADISQIVPPRCNQTRIECYDNDLYGELKLMPSREAAAASKITELRLSGNKRITGEIDCELLPHGLQEVSFDRNNHTGIINTWGLSYLRKLRHLNVNNNPLMTGWLDARYFAPTLQYLRLHNTAVGGENMGNFSEYPGSSLIEVSLQQSRLSGPVDMRNAPRTLTTLTFNDARFGEPSGAPFYGLCDAPTLPQLWRLNADNNHKLRSTLACNLTRFEKLRELRLQRIDMHDVLWLPALPNLTIFTMNGQGTKGGSKNSLLHGFTNFFLDLNHLPLWLTEFNFINVGLRGQVRIEPENVPYAFRHPSFIPFCDKILSGGNQIRHLPLCNITLTPSLSLVPTATRTATLTMSRTGSRSLFDWVAEWMLVVVMSGVKEVPQQWRAAALRDWECDGGARRCCEVQNATAVSNDSSSSSSTSFSHPPLLYSCSFSGLQGGSVRIDFPPSYPLRKFELTDSPTVAGTLRLDMMPEAMEELVVERTGGIAIGGGGNGGQQKPQQLNLSKLPPKMVNLSLCDLNNAAAGIVRSTAGPLSFFGVPASLRWLQLCGLNLTGSGGTIDFSVLPPSLVSLSLRRNGLAGTVPWADLPRQLQHLRLDGNSAAGTIDAAQLPSSLRTANLSQNLFSSISSSGGGGGLAALPDTIIVFDASHNHIASLLYDLQQQQQHQPELQHVFGAPAVLHEGLVQLFLHSNRLRGSLDADHLPGSLRNFTVASNMLAGTFEVPAAALTPYFSQHLAKFCRGIVPGNAFRKSLLCGITLTASRSRSAPSETLSAGNESQSRTGSVETLSLSDGNFTNTSELTLSEPSQSRGTATESAPTPSETGNGTATAEFTGTASPGETASRSLRPTPTDSIVVPPVPFERTPGLSGVLLGGAIAAALTPTASAAALIVSRQTAVARAFGGKNRTCGGPTREDPFVFFEDPLALDFDPERKDCMGMLAGVLVGNLAVSLGIYAVVWLFHASFDFFRYGFCPTRLEGSRSGWPIEVVSVFCYGFLLPPAVTAMFVGAVRCQSDWGGSLGAGAVLAGAWVLYEWYYRRERRERHVLVRAEVPREGGKCYGRAGVWVLMEMCVYAFNPSGVWRWPGAEEHERQLIQDRAVDDADEEEDAQEDEAAGSMSSRGEEHDIVIGGGAGGEPLSLSAVERARLRREKRQAMREAAAAAASQKQREAREEEEKEQQRARAEAAETNQQEEEEGANNEQSSGNQREQPQKRTPEEQAAHDHEQWLIFQKTSRLIDKYTKKSWWFLLFELAVRAVMTLGPALAEAVPPLYSCLVLRIIYLLAINVLMIAVWGRKPYLHRALFWATCIATLAEILVLLLLLIDEEFTEDSGLAEVLLMFAQVCANFFAVGVEVWMYFGETRRLLPWAFIEYTPKGKKRRGRNGEEEEKEDCGDEPQPETTNLAAMEQQLMETGAAAGAAGSGGDDDTDLELLAPPSGPAPSNTSMLITHHDSRPILPSSSASASALEAPAGQPENDDDDDDDAFNRLDRRLRRAYAELMHEDVEIVKPHEKFKAARDDFDAFVDI